MVADLIRETETALRHNTRRTALTMLGMAWGIATVVLLLAYGNGFSSAITNIFSSFGMKTMIVNGRTHIRAGCVVESRNTRPTHHGRSRISLPPISHR